MRFTEYSKFVRSTDQYAKKSKDTRLEIAMYGLVGEIGSVVTAMKKRRLGEDGQVDTDHATPEIMEELGDVLWYCFSVVQIVNNDRFVDVFARNIAKLANEMREKNERAQTISRALAALSKTNKTKFLRKASWFGKKRDRTFDDYQEVAFLTARTDRGTLLEVCVSVLWQLGAELMRLRLPQVERELNQSIKDRRPNDIIGDILWHIAAIASVYGQRLSNVAHENEKKVSFRRPDELPTTLHDEPVPIEEQKFPRRFDIAFITVRAGRSRMYFEGRQLGNDLTDNAYQDDGYRFHDVLHLANAAVLGWSPVLRDLLKRKRKYDSRVDEVEDGARAKIVEEAVIKIIHSEGEAAATQYGAASGPVRLYPTTDDVPFSLIKLIHRLVVGLEVRQNKYWEWEKAIVEGYRAFYDLRKEGQGTVTIDLSNRTLSFRPEVYVEVNGAVGGVGMSSIGTGEEGDLSDVEAGLSESEKADVEVDDPKDRGARIKRIYAAKRAILDAIGLTKPATSTLHELGVRLLGDSRVATKTAGSVRDEAWKKKIVGFKVAMTESETTTNCTALAILDPEPT